MTPEAQLTPEQKLRNLDYFLNRWQKMGFLTCQEAIEIYAEVGVALHEDEAYVDQIYADMIIGPHWVDGFGK